MSNHARNIVQLLLFRPEAVDENGDYDCIMDEDNMMQIVDDYLKANSVPMDSGNLIGSVKVRYKQIKNKVPDYKSFYMGWIEGRSDIIKMGENHE